MVINSYNNDIKSNNDINNYIDAENKIGLVSLQQQKQNDNNYNKRMQQISTERVQDETQLGRQGYLLGNVQEI